jgi:ER membrane protein complex subunit 1
LASSIHIPLRTTAADIPGTSHPTHSIQGHQLVLNPIFSGDQFVAIPTWRNSLPPNEGVQSIVGVGGGKGGRVASIGKVLGNRTTLYKYLNPRLIVVLTSSTEGAGTCGVYVMDSVKGSTIYHASLPARSHADGRRGGGVCDVKATFTENWLVYHYFDEDHDEGHGVGAKAKGWRVVTVEFYEGGGVDEKTKRYFFCLCSAFLWKVVDNSCYHSLQFGAIFVLA